MDAPPRTIIMRQNDLSDDEDLTIASSSQCVTELQRLQPATFGTSTGSHIHVLQWDDSLGAWKDVVFGDGISSLEGSLQTLAMGKLKKDGAIGVAPTTLHKFSKFPLEIRQMIWELCLPPRIIKLWYDEPHAIRRLHTHPLIASVNRDAFQVALRFGGWTPVMVKQKVFWSLSPYKPQDIWFSKKDMVYLGIDDCKTLTTQPVHGLDGNGICRPARNPATQLLISRDLGDRLGWPENPEYRKGQPLKEKYNDTPAGKILYDKFLKVRKSFMLEVHRFEVLLEGPAREKAIQAGLFGLWGDEPAFIDADDTAALCKYKALLEKGSGTFVIDPTTDADILYGFEAMNALDKSHGRSSGCWFLEQLLCVLGDLEEVKFDWGGVIRPSGKVNNGHPMVKKLGVSLPECKHVFVFELLSDEDTRREKDRLSWFYRSEDNEGEEAEGKPEEETDK